MSTAASATQSTSPVAAGNRTHGHQTGQDAPSDVFSSLLSLLSATHDDGETSTGLSLTDLSDLPAQDDADPAALPMFTGDEAKPLPGSNPSDIAAAVMSGWPLSAAPPASQGSHELAASRLATSHTAKESKPMAQAAMSAEAQGFDRATSSALTSTADALPVSAALSSASDGLAREAASTPAAAATPSKPGIDLRPLGMQAVGNGQRIELPAQTNTAPTNAVSSASATPLASASSSATSSASVQDVSATGEANAAPSSDPVASADASAAPGSTAQQMHAAKLKAHAPANAQVTAAAQNWRSTTSLTPATVGTAPARNAGFAARSTDVAASNPAATEANAGTADVESMAEAVSAAMDTQFGGQSGSQSSLRQGDPRAAALPDHLAAQLPEAASEGLELESMHAEQATPDADAQQAFAEAESEISPELGRWGANQVRQATLRVGDSAADAIDIQLRMNGQEAQVAFRTDNAEARANLEQNAGQSLQDMLGRSGISLSDVSVNSQRQDGGQASLQGGGDGGSSGQGSGRGTAGGRSSEPEANATPAHRAVQRRSDGSEPLDLFV